MNDADELREEDDVCEVGAEDEEDVDGLDRESHSSRDGSDHDHGNA